MVFLVSDRDSFLYISVQIFDANNWLMTFHEMFELFFYALNGLFKEMVKIKTCIM